MHNTIWGMISKTKTSFSLENFLQAPYHCRENISSLTKSSHMQLFGNNQVSEN